MRQIGTNTLVKGTGPCPQDKYRGSALRRTRCWVWPNPRLLGEGVRSQSPRLQMAQLHFSSLKVLEVFVDSFFSVSTSSPPGIRDKTLYLFLGSDHICVN